MTLLAYFAQHCYLALVEVLIRVEVLIIILMIPNCECTELHLKHFIVRMTSYSAQITNKVELLSVNLTFCVSVRRL